MSGIFTADTAYYITILISIAAAALCLRKLCALLNVRRQYIFLPVYIFLSLLMCLQKNTHSYAVTAVFFMLLGLLFYIKQDNLLYILWFGIAIAINYYAAFFLFALIIGDNSAAMKKFVSKCVALLLGTIPVCGVYFAEHFLFKDTTVCFWLPDFQLWNMLFDKHCLDGFYWFWLAYILLLAAVLVLFHRKSASEECAVPDYFTAQRSIWTGFACYSLFLYFSQTAPDFILMLLPFIILLAGAFIDEKIENICLEAAILIGLPAICFSSEDFDYGILSRAASAIFSAFSKIGLGSILVAACVIATITFLYNSFPFKKEIDK